MKRLILVVVCLTCLSGCTAFRALFNISNETGRSRELSEKKDVREELEFKEKYLHLWGEYTRRVGLIKKSDQIDVDKDWLSNPNSTLGAIATFGGLVHPFVGIGGMGGAGGIIMTMIIGYLRRKKELKKIDKDTARDHAHKDELHTLEKEKIEALHAQPPSVAVSEDTIQGTKKMRLSLAAEDGLKFYETDTKKTYIFNKTNWEIV